jgi:hypothetical protein
MRRAISVLPLLLLAALAGAPGIARAQGAVPTRQIPPSVLSELHMLESRFETALAADCDAERCFSKGCSYVDHEVADRPRASSLPGLGQDPGPGSVEAQEYLTRARCGFTHEESVTERDVQALIRRLRSKLAKGWLVVTIDHQQLDPIPAHLQLPPEPPEPEVPVEAEALPEPEPWSAGVAARELWTKLLPHFAWMIGVVLVTVAVTTIVWAWRRVGRESLEERALLAQMTQKEDAEGSDVQAAGTGSAEQPSEDDRAFVERQAAAWSERLDLVVGEEGADPELQALIRELLRSRDLPLLAKAVLRFPDSFLAAFPAGGDIANAKLELADYLKAVDEGTLPSDVDFFRALERHARAAALASQSDAEIVRSLRDEFGATGLVTLIEGVSPRTGAFLFALAPADEQHEMVRLLSRRQMAGMAEQLLRSNRMNQRETAYLFQVLEAARADEPLPAAPRTGAASDRGAAFDAAGALSVLLPNLGAAERGALFGGALERFHGSLPVWYRSIFVADMLFELEDEARTDLLLEVDVESLSAWLSLVDGDTRERLVAGLPDSLRVSVGAASAFPSRARQLALAERGRQDLARGFQRQLARANLSFEQVVQPDETRHRGAL